MPEVGNGPGLHIMAVNRSERRAVASVYVRLLETTVRSFIPYYGAVLSLCTRTHHDGQ